MERDRHDEQYEEGRSAANAAKDFRECPYTFANAGVSLSDYERGPWREQRNKWFHGWQDRRTEMASETSMARQLVKPSAEKGDGV